jgi:hypothetical protein
MTAHTQRTSLQRRCTRSLLASTSTSLLMTTHIMAMPTTAILIRMGIPIPMATIPMMTMSVKGTTQRQQSRGRNSQRLC